MEAAFLLQLLARQWGTNNVNNCSYYCHQGSGVGLSQSFGTGTATVTLDDVLQSDLVVLIGANPASNHPRFMAHLADLRRRSGKIVVINPYRELGLQHFSVPSDARSMLFGSDIANDYIQPHCGGDLAFLKAAAVKLWRDQHADLSLLENHCNDFPAFRDDLENQNLEDLLAKAGVSADDLTVFAIGWSHRKRRFFAGRWA